MKVINLSKKEDAVKFAETLGKILEPHAAITNQKVLEVRRLAREQSEARLKNNK